MGGEIGHDPRHACQFRPAIRFTDTWYVVMEHTTQATLTAARTIGSAFNTIAFAGGECCLGAGRIQASGAKRRRLHVVGDACQRGCFETQFQMFKVFTTEHPQLILATATDGDINDTIGVTALSPS